MKELSKKELHKQLTDKFVNDQFSSFLLLHPDKRTEAALYAAGQLQALLLESMQELPHHPYQELIRKLQG
jgi:hypothetical protein